MGRPGPKPKRKYPVSWSPNVAYGVGLFATDGCLYKDGLHLDFTSKDREQLNNFKKCFGLKTKITFKNSGRGTYYTRLQFGDVVLYQFFIGLGLTPNKSKTIGVLKVPKKYFFDFLRGVFDGDGSFYSYHDPRWRSSFMFYIVLASAGEKFIEWLRNEINDELAIRGHVSRARNRGALQLRYAKNDSLKIIKKMYYSPTVVCLSRKRGKILRALGQVT